MTPLPPTSGPRSLSRAGSAVILPIATSHKQDNSPALQDEQAQSVALAQQLGALPPGSAPIITQRPLQLHAVTQLSEPQAVTLTNGAQAFCQQMTSDQYSTLAIVLPVTPAHQLMQLMGSVLSANGSTQRKQQLDDWASQGLMVSMTPVYDRTVLVVNAKTGKEPQMVAAALEMLTHMPADPQAFAQEKATLLKNLADRDNAPGTTFAERMSQDLFGPQHPYALSHADLFEQLKTVTPTEVTGFYKAVAAHPETVQMVMTSPLPVQQQAALLNQQINQTGWQPNPSIPVVSGALGAVMPQLPAKGQPLLVAEPSLDRTRIEKLWLGPTPADPDFDAFQVMTSLLGGMTGPLFRILRTERGLVYSTTHLTDIHEKATAFEVMAAVDFDKMPQALDGLNEAIGSMLNQPPEGADLERVKREYVMQLRQERQQSADMTEKHLLRLGNGLTPEAVSAQEARIAKLTPEDIQRVAVRFLGDSNPNAITGLTAPEGVLKKQFPTVPVEQAQHIDPSALAQALSATSALARGDHSTNDDGSSPAPTFGKRWTA
jgi:predicted Zn-dependent peptidase